MRSNIREIRGFCNLNYVSHFAVFFVGAKAKISIVESCHMFVELQVASGLARQPGIIICITRTSPATLDPWLLTAAEFLLARGL